MRTRSRWIGRNQSSWCIHGAIEAGNNDIINIEDTPTDLVSVDIIKLLGQTGINLWARHTARNHGLYRPTKLCCWIIINRQAGGEE